MNFLSHYYFDRDINNCYHILGIVLPDLLKNADKNIILHPEKLHHPDKNINSIIAGWNKHLASTVISTLLIFLPFTPIS